MADTPAIGLPAALLPSDGRFGSGPSKVRTEALDALGATGATYLGTSHRQERVRAVVRRVREGLVALYGLPDGYEVLLGNGGATTFWDAIAYGLIEHRSAHAVFGEFSSKFAEAASAPHLGAPVVVESAPGTHPLLDAQPDVDVYALTHNETSTGVCMPVRRPADEGLVVVDGTSAAGGLRVDTAEYDVYFFSPQKCFASDGGLWLAFFAPAAVERLERVTASGRWVPPSLSLRLALDNSRLDQTYNTPPLASLFLMAEQIDWMLSHGDLDWCAGRCDTSAATVYGWAEAHEHATPFVTDPDMRSHVTATVDFDDSVDAATVARVLRANGIVDVEPYRKLGRNQLRIALFPAIEPEDVTVLTQAIDYVIAALAS